MTKENGLSLLDIADLTEDVPVGDDKFITVKGISAKEGLLILKRFPQIAELTKGFTLQKFMDTMPDAVAAILATATRHGGDEAHEEAASAIPLEIQFDMLEAVGRLTFKSGFGPFVQRMMALADVAKSANFGRASDTRLPQQSRPLSQPDIPQI